MADPKKLLLRPILDAERAMYVRQVTEEVSARYDDIGEQYALWNLRVHDERIDTHGFFSTRREVLTVESDGTVMGFTTLTYKLGGSVKTGPTIIMPELRSQGVGKRLRELIEERAVFNGARKVYCTASANNYAVLKYLLGTGYVVEAHLSRQYSNDHDELILGKLLHSGCARWQCPHRDSGGSSRVEELTESELDEAAGRFGEMFSTFLFSVPRVVARRILCDAVRGSLELPYEDKPRSALTLRSGSGYLGWVRFAN